jgi:hypothetical protein
VQLIESEWQLPAISKSSNWAGRPRRAAEFDQVRADCDAGYEWPAIHYEDWRRVLNVQSTLWRASKLRPEVNRVSTAEGAFPRKRYGRGCRDPRDSTKWPVRGPRARSRGNGL